MNLRFRKSKKILPGVRLNLTHKGVSANVGVRGANVGIGKTGVRANMSIPGTGISASQKLSGGQPSSSSGPSPYIVAGAVIGIVFIVGAIIVLTLLSVFVIRR